MKRIILGLIVLAILSASLPVVFGSLTKANMLDLVKDNKAKMDGRLAVYDYEWLEYNQGWLSSKAILRANIKHIETDEFAVINIPMTIQHGPWIESPNGIASYGIGSVNLEVPLSDLIDIYIQTYKKDIKTKNELAERLKELRKMTNNLPTMKVNISSDFNKNNMFQVSTDAFELIDNELGDEEVSFIKASELELSGIEYADGTLKIDMRMPNVNMKIKNRKNAININMQGLNIKHEGNGKLTSSDLGNTLFTMNSMVFNEEKLKLEIKKIRMEKSYRVHKGDGNIEANINMESINISEADHELDGRYSLDFHGLVERIDHEAYVEMIEQERMLDDLVNEEQIEVVKSSYKNFLQKTLPRKPSLTIKPFIIKQGVETVFELSMNVQVGDMHDVLIKNNPMLAIQALDGILDLSIRKKTLENIIEKGARSNINNEMNAAEILISNEEMNNAAREMSDTLINTAVQQGWVIDNGEVLSTQAILESGGEIRVNGIYSPMLRTMVPTVME